MLIDFNNIYLNEVSTIVGKKEKEGPLGKFFDLHINDFYNGEKTFEQCEIRMIKDNIINLLKKSNKKTSDISLIFGTDLLNQLVANNYSLKKFKIPYIGIYSACASFPAQVILASNLINKNIKNIICNLSSHNLTAERQFRNPVEYGAPRPKRSTYTATGCASCIISSDKSNIKIKNGYIGKIVDYNITDVNDMGSVMASSAADSLYNYFAKTNTKPDDYDLILTGDLGVYGKEILTKYLKEEYKIDIRKKVKDSGLILYDINNQKDVNAGASGPASIALVTFSYILDLIRKNKLKKVLLVATGALMNTTMCNQKLSIPSISHIICLEAIQ